MITITIDWGAGTWKGTTAKGVAKALGYVSVDTGAMYRWVSLVVLEAGADPLDGKQVFDTINELVFAYEYNTETDTFDLLINGVNREAQIRTPEVASICHITAQYPDVRAYVVKQQQALWVTWGVVFDARDGGTVIAPQAELKVHLIADIDIRALRRLEQYQLQWKTADLASIKINLYERDQQDLYGPNATNHIADDARDLDTSYLTIEQQIQAVVDRAKQITKT